MVTTTLTHTPEETEEEAKEALVVEKIEEITLQLPLPNLCLKESDKMGAYTSSLSLNALIEPHNARKSMTLCQSYTQTSVKCISTM